MTSHRALFILVALIAMVPLTLWLYRFFTYEQPLVVVAGQEDIVETVVITGKAKAAEEVNLAFPIGGRIAAVFVEEGERVSEGQQLLALDEEELRGSLAQAYATKRTEEAEYANLAAGPRDEDVQVAYAKLESARTALRETEQLLQVNARDAYSRADDAVHHAVDQLFSNPVSNPAFNYPVSESLLKSRLEAGRSAIGETLSDWVLQLDSTATTPENKVRASLEGLASVRDYLALIARAVNTFPSGTANDALKTSITSARSTIDGALSSLETAQKNVSVALSDVALLETQVTLAEAGVTSERLAVQRSRIALADAQIKTIEARLKDVALLAPISGVVTRQDGKRGQVATPSETLISIKSVSRLEVEAFVPEISIGKVAVGNPATLVFDAFPQEAFEGSVTHIEESETIRDGVTNYKITVSLREDNPRLRSGMSADITMVTARAPQAVSIPQYAITTLDGVPTVEKMISGEATRVRVQVGIVGSNGTVEIRSGVVAGDVLRVPFQKSE
ncbi:MAG: efflux RND transporter periplasmic adaptor subunit [Candidatus Pacebacteria bacterium]|nr:efflux RND transporter periplasmic adaptor subunit [Candidatus Paceibacterota bacterium]